MTTKTKPTLDKAVAHLSPCREAREWLSGYTSPAKAWEECQHGNWMLWLIGRTINCPPWLDGRKPLLDCCLDIAETVKHLWPEKQRGQIKSAIAVLRNWIKGKASQEEAESARNELWAAAAAAYTAAAYAAAYAAAADAASAADTADAASAASSAASSAAADAANASTKSLAQSADIVRKHYPKPPTVKHD